jgi:hypothetical protein
MLQTQIKQELKQAMLARDTEKMNVLRGLLTAFTNELVATKRTPQDELSDAEILMVIKRAVKQRKDSISQFEAGGRSELAEDEKKELAMLETYLPASMSREEIKKIALGKKEELGITDASKKGMFMSALMKEFKGQADGTDVKAVVDEILG